MSDHDYLQKLTEAGASIRQWAEQAACRFVLAESCTSGLCAATIGSQPGISEFFCGSHVTYRNDSKRRWLDVQADDLQKHGPVSESVATQMAEGALLATPEAQISVSITGHLGPQSPDGMDGVIFIGVAVRQSDELLTIAARFELPEAVRSERQQLAAMKALSCLGRVLQLQIAVQQVCQSTRPYYVIGNPQILALLPGSFNPVHQGHQQMVRFGREHLSGEVHYELSVENVDKPDLTQDDCISRLLSICLDGSIVLSRAPTFLSKARLLGKVCFLVGADTIGRIAETRYYADENGRDKALQELQELEVCFLVFGRTMDDSFLTSSCNQGSFTELADLPLPATLAAICQGVDSEEFREDVSSRDLR